MTFEIHFWCCVVAFMLFQLIPVLSDRFLWEPKFEMAAAFLSCLGAISIGFLFCFFYIWSIGFLVESVRDEQR